MDGYVLYNAFVVILGANHLKLRFYGIACYLVINQSDAGLKSHGIQIPAVIVIIAVSSRSGDFGSRSNCWINNRHGALWSFVAPMLIIIAINSVIFYLAMRNVLDINQKVRRQTGCDLPPKPDFLFRRSKTNAPHQASSTQASSRSA